MRWTLIHVVSIVFSLVLVLEVPKSWAQNIRGQKIQSAPVIRSQSSRTQNNPSLAIRSILSQRPYFLIPTRLLGVPHLKDPEEPLIVNHSYAPQYFTLVWEAMEGATSYEIYASNDPLFPPFPSDAFYRTPLGRFNSNTARVQGSVGNFPSTARYSRYFRVSACYEDVCGHSSNIVDISNGWLPYGRREPPVNRPEISIEGSFLSGQNYRVQWSAVEGTEFYFLEESKSPNFSNDNVRRAKTAVLFYPFSPVVFEDTTFYYRVRAENEYGYTDWSNVVSKRVHDHFNGQLCAPELRDPGTRISSRPQDQATLSWTPVNGATSYEVERSTSEFFPSGMTKRREINTTQGTFYHGIASRPGVIGGGWVEMTYYFRVRATNSNGRGSWSNSVDLTVVPYDQFKGN
ncbi:MAG: fibronectin type III domain-containing protein [Deltaproteobacteria bacterium]|nr:fibronectin type III domain-containing protein [Deltaproteobacteria bacterium]